MNGNGAEEETAFEIGVVLPKSSGNYKHGDNKSSDCIEVLVEEFRKAGLIVDRVVGLQNEFIRVRFRSKFSCITIVDVTIIKIFRG